MSLHRTAGSSLPSKSSISTVLFTVTVVPGHDWAEPRKACYENKYAYATLVEDCERLVDEVGYAEVWVRGLHG